MRSQALAVSSLAVALTLAPAAAPATAVPNQPPADSSSGAAAGEDAPKPGPTSREFFLVGVGVIYGRSPETPVRTARLAPADDNAALSPAIAIEWRLLDRLWLTTAASAGVDAKAALVVTGGVITFEGATFELEDLQSETSFASVDLGLRWVLLRSEVASLSVAGRFLAAWAKTDYSMPGLAALLDGAEVVTETGEPGGPVPELRGSTESTTVGGVVGLSAEHGFGAGLGLRLNLDLIEARLVQTAGSGPLADGARVSTDVHLDPKASVLVTMAF